MKKKQTVPQDLMGYLYGAVAVCGWGIFNTMTHQALESSFNPNDLTMLRYCVSGILCIPIALCLKLHKSELHIWLKMICLSVCGGPLFGWFVNKGIQFAPISHASVMVPTLTMLITLFLVFIQGKAISKYQLSGAFVIVAGLTLLVTGKSGIAPNTLLGDVYLFSAALLWSGFTLLLNKWKLPVFQCVVMINIISGLIYLPLFFIQTHHNISQIPAMQWLSQSLVQGVLSAIIVIYAYSQTVKLCGVGTASMLPALIPVTSLFTYFILTGERPAPIVITALVLIMTGFIVATKQRRHVVIAKD